jgi:hypothetical protein
VRGNKIFKSKWRGDYADRDYATDQGIKDFDEKIGGSFAAPYFYY